MAKSLAFSEAMAAEGRGGAAAEAAAYTLADQQRMRAAHRYQAWQFQFLRPHLGRRVVEVGCGIGNFTRRLLAVTGVETIVAFDREAACIAALARLAPSSRLRALVREATPATMREFAAADPDTCVCLNVLEHLDDDAGVMRAMVAMLATGGVLLLQVPALPALYGTIDRRLGHRRRYRRADIAALARAAGADLERLEFINCVGALGWWINGRLLRRRTQSAAQIAVFDRFIVPVASSIESRLPPPFGQSLFAVLRKPRVGGSC